MHFYAFYVHKKDSIFMRRKTSKKKKTFVIFVLFVRIKNIWVKVAYLRFVLFVLFMRIKNIWVEVTYFGFCAFCALCVHKKHLSESCLFTFCAFCVCEIFSWKKDKTVLMPLFILVLSERIWMKRRPRRT